MASEILEDGQPAEIAAFLGEIPDSEPGALEHGEVGDIDGIEGDRSAVRLDHAEDHAESGCFSGPVSAEEADDFPLAKQKADIVNDRAAAVGFDELGDFQKIHVEPGSRAGSVP